MSESKPNNKEKKRILIKMPVSTLKDSMILTGENSKNAEFLFRSLRYNNLQSNVEPLYKEDVIYESQKGDFLGDSHRVILINRLNKLTNNSLTIAKYISPTDEVVLKTSDNITKIIGQKNYDTVISALCSVISQELRIKSILALLTVQTKTNDVWCQSDIFDDNMRLIKSENIQTYMENSCQTDETSMDYFIKSKQRKRVRRQQLTPYVVKDKPSEKIESIVKKFIFNPVKNQPNTHTTVDQNNFKAETQKLTPDLKSNTFSDILVEENSNCSIKSISGVSIGSLSSLDLTEEKTKSILSSIDNHTENKQSVTNLNPTMLTMIDGTQISIPVKPEDHLHIATPDILKHVTNQERKLLLWNQAYIDWILCLKADESGELPLHVAVSNNDVDLIRRQCLVLKARHQSIDIATNENLTALQMSILQNSIPECTTMLMQQGADPLLTDDEERTALHLAAEGSTRQLEALIAGCQANARRILEESEDLWKPEFETKSKEELVKNLFRKMNIMYDNQGYTPLMLASKEGKYENVKLLIKMAPATVNWRMPTSGDTALFVAVTAAFSDAERSGNKSKISDCYMKTIETLVENGADPSIENCSGWSVNLYLSQYSNSELSMLIANKLTSIKYFDGEMPHSSKSFESYMLVKDEEGKINIKEMSERQKTDNRKTEQKTVILHNKPAITNLRSIRNIVKKKVLPPQAPIKYTFIKNSNTKNIQKAPNIKSNINISVQNTIVERATNIIIQNDNKLTTRNSNSPIDPLSISNIQSSSSLTVGNTNFTTGTVVQKLKRKLNVSDDTGQISDKKRTIT